MRLAWNEPLKGALYEGEAVKKRAIINLLNKTMSAHKRMFMHWHEFSVTLRHLLRSRATIALFENISSTLSSSLSDFITPDAIVKLKEKVLN